MAEEPSRELRRQSRSRAQGPTVIKIVVEPKSVGRVVRLVAHGRGEGDGGRRGGRIELPRVRVVPGMLEFAVGAEVVAACVSGPTERTLEPAREVHMVMISYVGHYLAAEFTSVQITTTWQLVER